MYEFQHLLISHTEFVILTIKKQENIAIKKATMENFKTLSVNSNKLQILDKMADDWNTTLEKVKLEVLINMYASRNYDPVPLYAKQGQKRMQNSPV